MPQATPPIRFATEKGDEKLVPVNRTTKQRSSSTFSWLSSLLMRFGIVYLIYSALWGCSSQPFSFQYDEGHSKLVCREIASAKSHITPVVNEYSTALHRHVEPYVGKQLTQVHGLWQKTQPLLHQGAGHAHATYWNHIEPAARKAYKDLYAWSRPHQRTLQRHYNKHLRSHVDASHKVLKPYLDVYNRDVLPHIKTAGEQAKRAYNHAGQVYEDEVHPRLKQGAYQTYLFVRHTVLPTAHEHYFTHAHPHVVTLWRRTVKFVDELLVKYGLKQRSTYDAMLNKVKSSFDTVSEMVQKRDEAPATADAASRVTETKEKTTPAGKPKTTASAVPEETTTSTAESKETTQPVDEDEFRDPELKRLDAELMKELDETKALLSGYDQRMLDLVTAEEDRVLDEISQLRGRHLIELPDRVQSTIMQGVEKGIVPLFQRLDRRILQETTSESREEAEEKARRIIGTEADRLLKIYGKVRERLGRLFNGTAEAEADIVETGVKRIQELGTEGSNAYAKAMTDARFKATVDEFDDWAMPMLRRGDLFRDDMNGERKAMSGTGDLASVHKRGVKVNLAEEYEELLNSLNHFFYGAEKSFSALAEQYLAKTTAAEDRSLQSISEKNIQEQLDLFRELGRVISHQTALRLRKGVEHTRFRLRLSKKPSSGIMLEVMALPEEEMNREVSGAVTKAMQALSGVTGITGVNATATSANATNAKATNATVTNATASNAAASNAAASNAAASKAAASNAAASNAIAANTTVASVTASNTTSTGAPGAANVTASATPASAAEVTPEAAAQATPEPMLDARSAETQAATMATPEPTPATASDTATESTVTTISEPAETPTSAETTPAVSTESLSSATAAVAATPTTTAAADAVTAVWNASSTTAAEAAASTASAAIAQPTASAQAAHTPRNVTSEAAAQATESPSQSAASPTSSAAAHETDPLAASSETAHASPSQRPPRASLAAHSPVPTVESAARSGSAKSAASAADYTAEPHAPRRAQSSEPYTPDDGTPSFSVTRRLKTKRFGTKPPGSTGVHDEL